MEDHEQHCNLCICMEYCQNGNIEQHVELHGRPNNKCAIRWAHQAASGLVYLHKHRKFAFSISIGHSSSWVLGGRAQFGWWIYSPRLQPRNMQH